MAPKYIFRKAYCLIHGPVCVRVRVRVRVCVCVCVCVGVKLIAFKHVPINVSLYRLYILF